MSIASSPKKNVCEGYMYINDDSTRSIKIIEIFYVNNKITFKIEPYNINSIIVDNIQYNAHKDIFTLTDIDSFSIIYDTVSYKYNKNGSINVIDKHNIFCKSVKYHMYNQNGKLKSAIDYINNYNFKNSKYLNYNQLYSEIYDYDYKNKLIRKYLYTNPYDTVLSLLSTSIFTYKNNKLVTDTTFNYDIFNSTNSTISSIFINNYNYKINKTIVNEYILKNNVLILVSRSDSGFIANHKNYEAYCQKEGILVKYKEIHYYSASGLLQKSLYFENTKYRPNYKLTIKYKYTDY